MGFLEVGVAGGEAGGGAGIVGDFVALEDECRRLEVGDAGGEVGEAAVVEPGGGAGNWHAIGEGHGFGADDFGAGLEAEGFGDAGGGVFDFIREAERGERGGLTPEAFAEAGTLADGVGEAPDGAHEGAAALFGDDDAFFGEDREGAADGVAIGGKPFCENGFGGETIAIGEFPADDVEADGIGDLTPEGDAAGN